MRPSVRLLSLLAAPSVGTTQILTSNVIRPIQRGAAVEAKPGGSSHLEPPRPEPPRPEPPRPEPPRPEPPRNPGFVSVAAASEAEPAQVRATWTLERKLLVVNLVLGVLALLEFIVF